MTQEIRNPFPLLLDRRGRPLTGGKIYVGAVGQDPELSPIPVFFNEALTIAAEQPVNVIGGVPVRSGNPARLFVEADEYSIRVRDADGAEVFYLANVSNPAGQFQPLDADLSAIADGGTTAFGRGVLAQSSASDARTYLGIVAALPLSGGTVTGDIRRAGAGAYAYMADPALTSARIFITANGAADPRTQPGDIWFEEAP